MFVRAQLEQTLGAMPLKMAALSCLVSMLQSDIALRL
jgi:hypothetical protein